MDIINSYAEKIRGRGLEVVFPEGGDQRILQAARRMLDDDLAEIVVLGNEETVSAGAAQAKVDLDGMVVLDPKRADSLDAYAQSYAAQRDLSPAIAKRVVAKPAFFAGMMVASGHADTMVGGAVTATATMIQSATLTVGLMEGLNTPSSYFLMVIPDFQGSKNKPFIYADCAVNIDPDAGQLADIAIASAASAKGLLDEPPRVAMLSYSTRGSAAGASVEKVNGALQIARQRDPALAIDGEFQADSAIIPSVASRKIKDRSDVAGHANVLVFPDLDAGNIAYKLTQYMANARAIGPFLQGFARPVADLSRGATVDDIVSTTILTLVQLV